MKSILFIIGLVIISVHSLNPTHYGNPAGGCLEYEANTNLDGTTLVGCFPDCFESPCPTDLPEGTNAEIKIYVGKKIVGVCALECKTDGSTICPKGA